MKLSVQTLTSTDMRDCGLGHEIDLYITLSHDGFFVHVCSINDADIDTLVGVLGWKIPLGRWAPHLSTVKAYQGRDSECISAMFSVYRYHIPLLQLAARIKISA